MKFYPAKRSRTVANRPNTRLDLVQPASRIVLVIEELRWWRDKPTILYRVAGGIASATVGAVFYGNSLLGSILFFWLSSRWVPLQSEWRAMERCIDRSISRHSCQVHSLARFTSLLIALFVACLPCTRASIPVNRHCTRKLQLVRPIV